MSENLRDQRKGFDTSNSPHRINGRLTGHPATEDVIFPGLPAPPRRGLAKARVFLKRFPLSSLAKSPGGVEGPVNHVAIMTRAFARRGVRARLGISDSRIRLSAGVEDGAGLIADREQALS